MERGSEGLRELLNTADRGQVNAICAGAFDERSHGLRDSELLQVAALLVSFEKLLQFGKSRNAFVMAINGKGAGLRFGSICFECASRPMIDA